MKIVFFGNTKYSVFGLEIINKKIPVSLVVTISDRASGRKRELKANAVKDFSLDHKIPILEADKLDESAISEIIKIKPDFLIVEDYGLILPESLLEIPRYAPLNIHHSLLPKYRGPSPAPAAILNREEFSGVTIICMTQDVDAGDILAQKKYKLAPRETTDSLRIKLNKLGGDLVLKVIDDFKKGKEMPRSQDDKQASYTTRFTKQDGYIDLDNPPDAKTLGRMIRAFYPWPGVYTELGIRNHELRKMKIKFLPSAHPTDPFMIQPEGKRPMTLVEFKNGYMAGFLQIKRLLEKEA